ncbi:MAG: hypothetical protein AB7F28_02815 [Candidatus Margulisiibacteriota bacterium]
MKKQDLLKKYSQLNPQFVLDQQGNKSMVLLTFDVYQHLIEDLADLTILAERDHEETVSIDTLQNKLKKSGRL